MSIIKDTFFGGAEKKAAKAQQKGIEKGIAATQAATRKAEGQLMDIFPAAQQNLAQGFQGALDVFGQSLPAQTQAFQQGNIGAQQQLLAGLPQIQNALFGNQVDFSQLQPTQIQPDLGFAQQQLPQFVDPFAPPPTTSTPSTFPNTGIDIGGALGGGFGRYSGGGKFIQEPAFNFMRGR